MDRVSVPVIIFDYLILRICLSSSLLGPEDWTRRAHVSAMLHKYSQCSVQDMFSCKAYLFIFRQIIEVVTNSRVGLPWLSGG